LKKKKKKLTIFLYFFKHFWLFLIIRSLVGVGEASYSCVAPTIIGDLFTGEMRTRMLAVFYLAVPVGSGLGYIVGSNVAAAFNDWRWALRMTPPLGLVCIILLLLLVDEPKRGGAEGSMMSESRTSFFADVVYLLKK
jgi:MFS family permease